MKSASLSFLLSSLIAVSAWGASSHERLLLRFYGRHYPKIQREYLQEVVGHVDKWAPRAWLGYEKDTFLSMIHRESEFDPTSVDYQPRPASSSVGICQVSLELRPYVRRWWKARGYEIGPDGDAEAEVALGLGAFRIKLDVAKGNVWGGVRRYNGGGPKAQQYARNVFKTRASVFGRPYVDGERTVAEGPPPKKRRK